MNRNIKKVAKFFLLSSIILITMTVSYDIKASNSNYKEISEEEFNEVYEEYKNDPQYQMMLESYGQDYANEFINNVIRNRNNELILRGGGGNDCYQHVKNIKQTKTYNCGTTTVLQTLYGLGSESQVVGNTDSAKIATLDSEYNVDANGFIYVYQITNALNKYLIGNKTYVYTVGNSMSISQFESKIAESLTYGKPIVLHARTQYFDYYEGAEYGHYISLDQINRTSDMVRVVDCHFNDDYYGIHYVTLAEAYNSLNSKWQYLIH